MAAKQTWWLLHRPSNKRAIVEAGIKIAIDSNNFFQTIHSLRRDDKHARRRERLRNMIRLPDATSKPASPFQIVRVRREWGTTDRVHH